MPPLSAPCPGMPKAALIYSAFMKTPLLLAAVAICALAKAPITHEDVWLMKRVGAPTPSPDGKWVVFSVAEPAYDDAKEMADLWIVPADGSAAPRRLTFTRGPETGA